MTTIGIDLGTTNSLVCVWKDGAPQLVNNALGTTLTPSVVSLDDENRLIIGQAAKDRLQTHPDRTAQLFKRSMGTGTTYDLGEQSLRSEDLSALVLGSLKADAEAFLGTKVDSAVITVPAYFNDIQRQATKIAGDLAGLQVLRLINEPTAASIAYGLHEKDAYSNIMVLDLGGGTFDVSVLEMFEGVMQIHSSAGDNRLGGQDFTEELVKWAAQGLEIKLDDITLSERADLTEAAERLKQTLSSAESGKLELGRGAGGRSLSCAREEFEKLSEPLLRRMVKPIERALRDATLDSSELDGVVLVGGASRMPIIRSLASRLIGQLPFVKVNPDEVVAIGAAVQVGLMQDDAALEEIVLTDVAPYSLGIGTINPAGGHDASALFSPIIERNTPIPASRSQGYITVHDFQTSVDLTPYQGEAPKVVDNIKLGDLSVKVPRNKAGEEAIEVRFTYDISGLLEIEATVESTGKTERLVVQRSESALNEDEVEKRLAELQNLKVHPRENQANIAVIARAERLYQEFLGEHRDLILKQITAFEQVVDTQEPNAIEKSRKKLLEVIAQLEEL